MKKNIIIFIVLSLIACKKSSFIVSKSDSKKALNQELISNQSNGLTNVVQDSFNHYEACYVMGYQDAKRSIQNIASDVIPLNTKTIYYVYDLVNGKLPTQTTYDVYVQTKPDKKFISWAPAGEDAYQRVIIGINTFIHSSLYIITKERSTNDECSRAIWDAYQQAAVDAAVPTN